jgi:soluble lytic murein transglycosylase-like protein
MRLLSLAFNVVLSASLLGLASDTSAAAHLKKIKHNRPHHHKPHFNSQGKRQKSTSVVIPARRSYRPSDVWERIRLGMQNDSLINKFILEAESAPSPNTITLDINPLLQTPAVQMRLYKFQRFNIEVLKSVLKQPSALSIKRSGEWHLAQNKKNRSAYAVTLAAKTDKRVSDKYWPGSNLTVRTKTSPACAPALINAESKSNFIPPNPEFISAVFVQPGIYAPRATPDFGPPNVSLTPPPPHHCDTQSNGVAGSQQDALTGIGYTTEALTPWQQKTVYARINKQVDWFAKRPAYLQLVAERARPYLYHIVEELSKHKLPLELALLPIVESAYQPTALSPKSAAGLWQFMPNTGKDFNLKQNDAYDDRLDVTASTRAAIHFLSHLHKHFKGDWLLALAAYNAGQGTVDAAIRQNSAKNLPTDYWSLALPEETENYVPRLLALATIFANPARYQLNVKPIKNEPYFIKVNIDRKAEMQQLVNKDLKTIAQLANLSYEHFSLLNPGYLNSTLPENGPFSFLMPAPNANELHKKLELLANAERNDPLASSFLSVYFPDKQGNSTAALTDDHLALNPGPI